MRQRKLFCEINPTCYAISQKKEILKRHLQNMLSKEKIAKEKSDEILPNVVYQSESYLIKKGKGIDERLQRNKVVNIDLASKKIHKILIHPGEVFSFWILVGKTSRKRGYREGRVFVGNQLKPGLGGGLCNLGNTIHYLVLHSPLDVVEFHKHSDALAPDHGKRVPFSSGTSVDYNYQDYRFKNNTQQDFQILLWVENDTLHAELRSEKKIPYQYQIVEENHHFQKEGEKYYRISKIYKETIDKKSGKVIDKKLVLDNHSEVMYDYSLIPEYLIHN